MNVLSDPHALSDWLLRTSLQIALLTAAVLLVTTLARRRLSPACRHALWLLVALRLAIPVLPSSPWSIFNLFDNQTSEITTTPLPASEPQAGWIISKGPLPAQMPHVLQQEVQPGISEWDWRHVLLVFWLAGIVTFLARTLVANLAFARRMREGTGVYDAGLLALLRACQRDMDMQTPVRLIATDAVSGPALWGITRPAILIPPAMLRDLSPQDLRFIFLHELAHLKRADIAADWCLALLHALHWFNPAVWLALSRLRAERELARDAMVLSASGPQEELGYGQTILKLVQTISPPGLLRPGTVGILEQKRQLKQRIAMIAGFDRRTSRGRALAAVLALLIASLLLTDRRTAANAAPSKDAPAGKLPEKRLPPVLAAEHPLEPDPRQATEAEADPNAAAERLLARTLPEMRFEAISLIDAIGFLRDTTSADIVVSWATLKKARVDRNAPVTLRLRNATFSTALRRILDHVGGDDAKLDFTVHDGVITITTADDLASDTDIMVYDVRDLLAVDDEKDEQRATAKRDALVKELTTLITHTIDPPSWKKFGSIRHIAGQLVITATRRNHGEILRMLDKLREARAIQISLEVRFITVTPDLIEQHKIGHGAGKGVGFMNDEQAAALLRATQQDANSTILSAPRITLVNGQKGSAKVLQQNPYVADFEKVNGEFQPQIATHSSGVVFEVAATSSADRKYVTLDAHPQVTHLLELTEVPWKHAPPGRDDLKVQVPKETKAEWKGVVSVPSGGTMAMVLDPALVGDGKAPEQRIVVLVKPKILVRPPAAQQPFPLIHEPEKPTILNDPEELIP